MAFCTQVVTDASGSQLLALMSGSDPASCAGPVVLSASEFSDWLAGLTAFGFDETLFDQAFGAGLLLFITGLGVGYLISLLRKTRP